MPAARFPRWSRRGVTGFVDDYREMVAALEQADALDPLELRRAVGERFSPQRMVADYVNAFRATLARPRPHRPDVAQ